MVSSIIEVKDIDKVRIYMINKIKKRINGIPLEARVSVAYTVSSILQNSISFITLPLFTRLLSKEEYGQYSVYSSWYAILVIFLTLNLPYGSFSKAMVKYEDKRNQYIASAEGIGIVLSCIFLIIYLPFAKYWNKIFELPTLIMVLMVMEVMANMAIALWSGKKRFEFKYIGVISVTLLISFLAPCSAYLMVMHSEDKGYARIFGYSGVTVAIGAVFLIYNIAKGREIFNKEYWKYALSFNIPLLIYYISQVIFNQSDRIMISHFWGKGKAAMYSVAYSLALVLTFVLNAINNSYVPWFYQKIKEQKEADNRKISLMIAILIAVLLEGVIWIAPEFIYIMAGEAYYEAIWVVAPVAASFLLLFYTQLFVNVLFYFEEKKLLVFSSVLAALLNILLNLICIPTFGFVAAGYTTLFSYLVFAVCNYYAMLWAIRNYQQLKKAYSIGGLLGILAAFLLLSTIALLLYNQPIIRYSIIGLVLLFLLVNYHKVIIITKNILNFKE